MFEAITLELEKQKKIGVSPSHWEIGIDKLKFLFSSGLVQRVDPSSFTLAGIPVKITQADPESFRLIQDA